jgi:hypothetical protein
MEDLSFLPCRPGTYTLRATLQGFEMSVYSGIIVNAARTTNLTVLLKPGAITDTVKGVGGAPVLQTTTTMVSDTVDQKYLQDLPLPGRSALPFALLMAGAQHGVTPRDSTFNGLPGAAVNITLNGIANNAQRFKSGSTSFFAFVTPRLETIQEVTVSTATLGADSTGQGGMQISNHFDGLRSHDDDNDAAPSGPVPNSPGILGANARGAGAGNARLASSEREEQEEISSRMSSGDSGRDRICARPLQQGGAPSQHRWRCA